MTEPDISEPSDPTTCEPSEPTSASSVSSSIPAGTTQRPSFVTARCRMMKPWMASSVSSSK